MIPNSFASHLFGRQVLHPKDNTRVQEKAIKTAQRRYPDQAEGVRELNDFLTSLALTPNQMEHFLNMNCVDDFMGQGTEAPLRYGLERFGGDSVRWGAILKKLYQSCGPNAARALWPRFDETLAQALESLKQEFHLT